MAPLLLSATIIAVLATNAQAATSRGHLQVRALSVEPRYLLVGNVVTVDAEVVNTGPQPVHGLRISFVIAGNRKTNDWTPLDQYLGLAVLAPGEAVHFRNRARLNSPGDYLIGVVVPAADATLLPQTLPVRAISPAEIALRLGIFGTVFALLLTVVWGLYRSHRTSGADQGHYSGGRMRR